MEEHVHHHHSHDRDSCCEDHGGLTIAFHEGALIGTLAGAVQAGSVDEAKELVSSALTALAARVNGEGGVIGHIKAIVSEEGRGYQISVTDEEAMVRSLPPSSYRADCAVIVFSLEEDRLRDLMRETLEPLIVPETECEEGE